MFRDRASARMFRDSIAKLQLSEAQPTSQATAIGSSHPAELCQTVIRSDVSRLCRETPAERKLGQTCRVRLEFVSKLPNILLVTVNPHIPHLIAAGRFALPARNSS